MQALRSFGKQLPPKPAPAYRNLGPMRTSEPMPLRTSSMSQPRISHRFDRSFMNEMRVASIEFAAYLVSSAERRSITSMRSLVRVNGAYRLRRLSMARLSSAPTITRSGFMKSLTASPSFRNSGFDATANSCLVRAFMRASILSPVPTGTVDFVTMTAQPVSASATSSAALKMYCRSAEPSGPGGVPTASRMMSAPATPLATSVVNSRRPSAAIVSTSLTRPGSMMRSSLLFRPSIFDLSRSQQATSYPMSENPAPATKPSYPVPMTHIFMAAGIP